MVSTASVKTVVLTGPTASGKTAIALDLARRHGGTEIINSDSLLVYRGMNIGTAKPTAEEIAAVPHHLIDVRNPDEPFTAGDFIRAVESALGDIQARGRQALIVGGSGFYLKALLFGLWDVPPGDPGLRRELELRPARELYDELFSVDAEAALRITPNDPYRLVRAHQVMRQTGKTPTALEAAQSKIPDPRFLLWVVDRGSTELRARVQERTSRMLAMGLLEETQSLQARYPGCRPLSAIGYAQVQAYLRGEDPPGRKLRPGLTGLQDEIELATLQLVKRQRTWFRGQKTAVQFTLDEDVPKIRDEFAQIYEG